ncbi:MAG: response regulator [Thermodesulfobacteriota bacterium]|nr:response regulator [Thermodesulfobacteriota bacterium]
MEGIPKEDNRKRVLIVEDNPDHAELMKRAIYKHDNNFVIDITAYAKECLTMLDKEVYKVILLDYTLPMTNGLEVLKKINERGYRIPVIMVTGQGDEKIAVEAMKLGTYDYITKSGDYLLTLPFVINNTIERFSAIREKERLYQEVKETKEYLENLLENANDIIYTIDMDGRFTYINRKVEEYGAKRDKMIGRDFFSFLPEKHSKKKIKDMIMSGKKKYFETMFKSKSDEPRYVIISTFPIKDEQGKINAISGISRDITDTKRMEQKQHEMEIELMEQHKLSSIGTLVQGIAHNMNSPLTGISGRAQLLEKRLEKQRKRLMGLSKEIRNKELGNLIEECDKFIKDTISIDENVDRLAGIIKNMMYKSWQEQTDELQMININELIREELAFLEADMFFKHDIKKTCIFDQSIPPIKAIYSDLSQSFINFVRNALDAMYNSEKKELKVTTKRIKNHIHIIINDTGVGIKKEDIPKIFDPFFTTKPSNSTDGSPTGIGLGLHSSYVLLKKYNVKIDTKSKPGDTTFVLKIPFEKLR